MEFCEKLQMLRNSRGLTQEELAEKLYVSRTAVSKWESGRGYPSIASLKELASFFNVTLDGLVCAENVISPGGENMNEKGKRYSGLLCGALDMLSLLLFFAPVFRQEAGGGIMSVSLFALGGVSAWLKTGFFALVLLMLANGIAEAVTGQKKGKRPMLAGFALSVAAAALFALSRQPYPAVFCLLSLAVKGLMTVKDAFPGVKRAA